MLQDGKAIDNIWFQVYNWYLANEAWKDKLQESIKGLKYTNLPQNIDKEIIDNLYGNTLKTSVSKLEQYRKCPFSFYVEYGLRLQEESKFQVRPLDTGSFLHEIIDSFFDEVKESNLDIKQMERTQIDELVEKIIEEKLRFRQKLYF